MEACFLARNGQDRCARETTGAVLVFSGDKSRKERPTEQDAHHYYRLNEYRDSVPF
jgi:hypothetical protein